MPSSAESSADPLDRKLLRLAMRAWDDCRRLGTLPLASTPAAEARRRLAGYRDTPVGRGIAARDLLRQALESLRPESGDPDPADPRWRGYLILTEQYVQGRRPDYVAETLSVARSTFDHEQAAAFDRLGAVLREWCERGIPDGLTGGQAAAPARRAPMLAPAEADQPLFGRASLLQLCRERLLGPSRLLVVSGLPGAGKTALAAALAHDEHVRQRYADGVLWTGLGQHPDLAARLGAWGLALGWQMEEIAAIPALDDRARTLQAALHDRRMLVVIDDAWTLQAARALQLGGPASAHLVTTRSPALAAELAGEQAVLVPELDPSSGADLLRFFAAGTPRDSVERLVQAVGGLPLALVLMGRHLRLEGRMAQSRRIETALERLLDPAARMDLSSARSTLEAQPSLAIEAPITLRRVIALSDAALGDRERRILGAVAVFPAKPNTFSEAAALAVSQGDPAAWDALLDAGLVEGTGGSRFTLHPAVADYAATLGQAEHAAGRLIEWAASLPEAEGGDLRDLAPDESNALAAMRSAAVPGWSERLPRLLEAWSGYFEASGRVDALSPWLDLAVDITGTTGGPDHRRALERRARASYLRGNYPAAAEDAQANLALCEAAGDSRGACACWKVLTLAAQARGAAEEAWLLAGRGIKAATAAGLELERAEMLSNLGALAAQRGEREQAREDYRTALALARSIGARRLESTLLANLSVLAAGSGDLEGAESGLQEAAELAHADGDQRTMASLLINLGALAFDRGDAPVAEARFREALDLARQRADPATQTHALANLGRVVAARGALDEAEALYAEGLSQARRIGHREHLTQLLVNAGALRRLRGQKSEARELLAEAAELARAMRHPRFTAAAEAELDLLVD